MLHPLNRHFDSMQCFCKSIVTTEDKKKMRHVISLHYTLLQLLAEVNQAKWPP